MTYSLRAGTAGDFDEASRVLFTAFHEPVAYEAAVERPVYEPERAVLIHDGTDLVATAGAYTRDLTVPGAGVPAAYVTMVSVAATHRRRGLLTRMMHHQLRELHTAGREPVAVLWASEGRIYQRFGYGLATPRVVLRIDTREVRLPQRAGEAPVGVREVAPGAARPLLQAVYERQRPLRPGFASRPERWWDYVLADPPSRQRGGTGLRCVVVDGRDGVDGYALWRTKAEWESRGPCGVTRVQEVVAATPEAYRGLWRFLLSIDLTRETTYGFGAVDEPLLYLADEPRRLGAELHDGLWLRVVDVPAALAARRYAAPVDVVLAVDDDVLPENTGAWRLTGDAGGAVCARTDEPAQLRLDVGTLGALYLGGTPLGALVAAGRVRLADPGALPGLAAAFGWHRAPAGIEMF